VIQRPPLAAIARDGRAFHDLLPLAKVHGGVDGYSMDPSPVAALQATEANFFFFSMDVEAAETAKIMLREQTDGLAIGYGRKRTDSRLVTGVRMYSTRCGQEEFGAAAVSRGNRKDGGKRYNCAAVR
jgi:hypothetical protein